jgi:nucleoside-diphosphate kinase
MQRTLLLIKPDGVQRQLVGRILSRIEDKGLKIVGLKMKNLDRETAEEHYAPHEDKPFYEDLLEFITAGPLIAGVLEGPEAIPVTRKLLGETFGQEATPGTIRGDFGQSRSFNLVHGSDSPESAEREISLFFSEDELVEYDLPNDRWHYKQEDIDAADES